MIRIRKTWLGGIRKVVEAPKDHIVAIVPDMVDIRGNEIKLGAAISADPQVGKKVLPTNADELFPYRQKELVRTINERLEKGLRITSHDVLCINRKHDVAKSKPNFAYKPYKFSSAQYSPQYAQWIVDNVQKNPDFLSECRDAWRDTFAEKLKSAKTRPSRGQKTKA